MCESLLPLWLPRFGTTSTMQLACTRPTSSICRTLIPTSAISSSARGGLSTSGKTNVALAKVANALARLEEAINSPASPLQSDAVIQRFEFTFELFWKALRIHLSENEGIEVASP